MSKRRLTPQEKKVLRYMSDGRNSYGESPTSSRKNIRRFKQRSRRTERSAVSQALRSLSPEDAEQHVENRQAQRPWKTKVADRPLVTEVIEKQPLSEDGSFNQSDLQKEANRRLRRSSPAEIYDSRPERY